MSKSLHLENSKSVNTFLHEMSKEITETVKGENLKASDFQKFCQIKRFYERWMADKGFRDDFLVAPEKSMKLHHLLIPPEVVKPIWDTDFVYDKNQHQNMDYFSIFEKVFFKRAKALNLQSFSADPRFKAWRNRQLNRCKSQIHPQYHQGLGHYPACFELSRGCSVGCWFCGISAPKLDDIFLHNEENTNLWRQVLELLKRKLGDEVSSSFCYWATDPLDNPDYEKFCLDFHQILGKFPYTSTAQAWKYPERVKALLELSRKKGRTNNRFSILSLKMLNQIHQQFNAQELATVEFAFQNPEALSSKAIVGKANKRTQNPSTQISEQPSIACVTGFLFNMVERSVKLISPCPASNQWPDGYIVFDEGKFSDIISLENLIEKMISRNMSECVTDNRKLKFREDIKYESLPNGFQLSTRIITRKFSNQPKLRELGKALHTGIFGMREIVSLMKNFGVPEANTLYFLNLLLNKGVFEDELYTRQT